MTWEKLRTQPEDIIAPMFPTPKGHVDTSDSIVKKRTKETHPSSAFVAPSKKGEKLPEKKTGQMSLQLLEGAVNRELSDFASQDDSPPDTPQQWQAMTSMHHNHSGDMPQWW